MPSITPLIARVFDDPHANARTAGAPTGTVSSPRDGSNASNAVTARPATVDLDLRLLARD